MSDQISIPAVFMRGGTSRGMLFHKKDLPKNKKILTEYLLKIMGSPDIRQIDGMGGATSVTNKVCIISKSKEKNVDIDYFFAQVEIDEMRVDYEPTCGNMLSAVAPFSIEENLVEARDIETKVLVRSVNTGSLNEIIVKTPDKKVCYKGNFKIDGVPFKASPIFINFLEIEGSKTSKLFPTNNYIDTIENISLTCIDLGNPIILAKAIDFNIYGDESYEVLNQNITLLNKIEKVRKMAAYKMGMGDVTKKVLPKFILVAKSKKKGNIISRYFTPNTCHQTHAVSGSICLAAACFIPGTIPNHLFQRVNNDIFSVKIEHPMGEIDTFVNLEKDFKKNLSLKKRLIKSCGIYRTARKIMKGHVYVSL